MKWVLDSHGAVVHRNRQWYEFTGLNEDDPRDRSRARAIHPEDLEAVERLLHEAVVMHLPFLLTFRLRHAHKGYAWVMAGGTPMLSPTDGSFLGYMGSTVPLPYPPDLPRVMNLMYPPSHPKRAKSSVPILDTVAEHVATARNMAKHNDNPVIVKMLDFCLILIGDLLYRSMEDK